MEHHHLNPTPNARSTSPAHSAPPDVSPRPRKASVLHHHLAPLAPLLEAFGYPCTPTGLNQLVQQHRSLIAHYARSVLREHYFPLTPQQEEELTQEMAYTYSLALRRFRIPATRDRATIRGSFVSYVKQWCLGATRRWLYKQMQHRNKQWEPLLGGGTSLTHEDALEYVVSITQATHHPKSNYLQPPDALASEREDLRRLDALLRQHLPPSDYQFLVEHFGLHGCIPKTIREFSQLWNIPVYTLRRIRQRIFKKLRLLCGDALRVLF
ncbi:MAG: sigma-70 family RNA polymerase sigma factor [Vampirovibrionales bacterium]